jgi:putative DNA primase/helicase
MMDFIAFAQQHGILINELPPHGVWKRYPTQDHPRKRNGAVKWLGTHGFVQNHALSTVVSLWKETDRSQLPSMREIAKATAIAERQRKEQHIKAMHKAVAMLNESGYSTHPYLVAKGFQEEQGNVLTIDGTPVLLIPMRCGGNLVGLQQIWPDGRKRFLYGQRTAGAAFGFDNKGINVLCEGYATALSIRAAFKQLKQRYFIHVCFSAGNMIRVADQLEPGIVIADNDESGTGQQAAADIGWPTWISDRTGEDANDYHKRVGLFAFTQSLQESMLNIRAARHHER